MSILYKHMLSTVAMCCISLLFSRMMPAQDLVQLKVESVDAKGVLANKISYHIAKNTSSKGLADFAIVQKGIADPSSARRNLASLPMFGKVSPYSFLARNGVGPDKGGYIRYQGDATIYTFRDVPMNSSSVVDSMMLLIFGIADSYPLGQDIIVAGDVTVDAIKEKLNVMSMLVSSRGPSPKAPDYVWKDEDAKYQFRHLWASNEASVSAMYDSPRTSRESMNTAQPIVAEKFSHELGTILKARLFRELYKKGVPVSGIEFKRRASDEGPEDEMYGITIHTDTTHISTAATILASTLAYLDSHGANVEEYEDAKNDLFSNASTIASSSQSANAALVSKCIASYLYGANLASDKTITSFFTSKDLDSKVELSLFNNFVSALLDKSKNLTLRVTSSNYADSSLVRKAFEKGWDEYRKDAYTASFRINSADTLGLKTSLSKVKFKSSESEPISSGEMWTFSNGMKVIYKKNTKSAGEFSYSMMIRGSYSDILDIEPEKEKYVADMLSLYDVAGLLNYDFNRMLAANGVKLSAEVSPSGLSLSGSAPSNKLMLLMKSLVALSNERIFNESAYDYYKANGSLTKDVSFLDDLFMTKAQKYYDRMLSHYGDGYLVLVGDLDASSVKKVLCQYIGGLEQGSGSIARTQRRQSLSSGCTTDIKELMSLPEGSILGVTIKMSTGVSFTAERLMALKIAELALQKAMVREMVPLGMYVSTESSFRITPQERFFLNVTCHPSAYDGLPEGISPADPLNVLIAARKALSNVSSKNLDKADLQLYKTLLINNIQSVEQNPDYIVGAIQTRYLDGKDVITRYKDRINAVSADMVREVLSSLDSGLKTEEVIR